MAPTVPRREVFSASRRWCLCPAVVLTLAAALSCGDEMILPDPEPARVTIGPSSLEFAALQDTARLSAQVHDQYGDLMADAAVTWSSGATGVATVGGTGLVEAAGNGSATITATAGGVSAAASVEVVQVPASVELSPDSLAFGAFGDTATLEAAVADRNGHGIAGAEVEWSSDDDAVAVVDAAGRVESAGNGSATITATAGGVSAAASVEVVQVPASVELSPDSLAFEAFGDTATLEAAVADRNGHGIAGAEVEWSSDDDAVAVVDAAGRVESAGNGSATITATAGGVSAAASVEVAQVPASVELSPDSLAFGAFGDTATLEATVEDGNGHVIEGAEVDWSSDDDEVAVVDAAGRVESAGNGIATITATAGAVSAAASVEVVQVPASVELSPDSLAFDAFGDTATLEAVVADRNGHGIAGAEVEWSSDDDAVAVVDAAGRVESVGSGIATITATAGAVSAAASVEVVQVPASVELSPDSLAFGAFGEQATLEATIEDGNGHGIEGAEVEWSSDDDAVAVVDAAGRVESAGNGSATITATAGGVSGTASVEVVQVPASVELSPDSLAFEAFGDTATLEAAVADRNGHGIAGAEVEWSSDDDAVAVVDADGLVEAAGNGSATITATAGDVSAAASVEVVQVPASVELSPDSLPFGDIGDTATVAATVEDGNGHVIAGAEVEWSSDNIAVAAVDADGVVRATGNGATYVRARSGAAEDSARVSVVPSLDRHVLIRLYEATSGPDWTNNANWLTAKPMRDWHGVTVDAGGRVTWLYLGNNALAGPIPPELGQLASLQILSLNGNSVTGPIPPELGQLANLQTLTLWGNELTGPIPPELGQLASLQILSLNGNSVTGPIPPELGNLSGLQWLNLGDNELTGPIPPELGNLSSLRNLSLYSNELTGEIPPELGQLGNLQRLFLSSNELTGPIPPELGNLSSLQWLNLWGNELTGPIPPELGQLANLQTLNLWGNDLTGPIPPELGNLSSLRGLSLNGNSVTGPIPPELGQLASLQILSLNGNSVTGPIPPELGQLANLQTLTLWGNELTGELPPELGQLGNLQRLFLSSNELTGPIPPELGNLSSLQWLLLRNNDLTGPIPPELGGVTELVHLGLSGNDGLSGVLPDSLTKLDALEALLAGNTGVCAPADSAFQAWLKGVRTQRVSQCAPAAAYLTQAVQSREHPVPLVAREDALLRAFVTAANPGSHTMPRVVARFYRDGDEVHKVDSPASSNPIPDTIDESSLKASANAVIPGSVVKPGLELVVEVDPDGTLPDSVGVTRRIPAEGRLAIEVLEAPRFDLTLIPFLYEPDPDSSIIGTVGDMADDEGDHDLLQQTAYLLGVEEMDVTAHSPVETSSRSGFRVLSETGATRVLEGGTGHWKGMMPSFSDVGGVAHLPGWTSASVPHSQTIVHELGHNFNLRHAPCGGAGGPDPEFPDPHGRIGAWGYALDTVVRSPSGRYFRKGELVRPSVPDLMSYCGNPEWISDYFFAKAHRYRVDTEGGEEGDEPPAPPERSLLLWGGVDSTGTLHLEPAFVVDAPPALPEAAGDHVIEGRSADGAVLFSLAFEMPRIADAGEGAGGFAFVLPVRPEWGGRLAGITLTGPGGAEEAVTLDGATDAPMAIHRDRRTGEVRAILRAERALGGAPAGTEVLRSRGIPGPEAWRR